MYEVPSRSKRDDEFSGDGFAQRLFALAVRLQVCESASPTWTRCGIVSPSSSSTAPPNMASVSYRFFAFRSN